MIKVYWSHVLHSQLSRLPLSPCQLLAGLDNFHHLKVRLIHFHSDLVYILRLPHQLRVHQQYCVRYLKEDYSAGLSTCILLFT